MLWIVSVIGTRPAQRGIPDVANAAVVLPSKVSAEGGSVGRRVFSSRQNETSIHSLDASQKFANDNNIFGDENDDESVKKRNEELRAFIDEHDLSWAITLRNGCLYVELPHQLKDGSKEMFIDLLEFADDVLKCRHVIVCFGKTRPDRAALVKTFMFLGFHVLSPDNLLMALDDKHQDQLYMVYIVDSD